MATNRYLDQAIYDQQVLNCEDNYMIEFEYLTPSGTVPGQEQYKIRLIDYPSLFCYEVNYQQEITGTHSQLKWSRIVDSQIEFMKARLKDYIQKQWHRECNPQ